MPRTPWKAGDAYVWLSGLALMITLVMIGGLLWLIASKGLSSLWPADVGRYELRDGSAYLGQLRDRERTRGSGGVSGEDYRVKLKIGNRDVYGLDFRWVDESKIAEVSYPEDAVILERREWGNYHGFVREIRADGGTVPASDPGAFSLLLRLVDDANDVYADILSIEKGEMGDINHGLEKQRLRLRGLAMKGADDPGKTAEIGRRIEEYEAAYAVSERRLAELYEELGGNEVVMVSAGGEEKTVPLGKVVRAFRPNSMNVADKTGFYLARFWGFVTEDPREANTEGGIFPAIFGTVLMVMIMSVVVMPFGVVAALYLREYARQGTLVRVVRICVNNLAGVPSIVFGVFGVGFFLYGVGGIMDAAFFREALPSPTFGTGGILWRPSPSPCSPCPW